MSERKNYLFSVGGMSCGGCASAVQKIVKRIDPEAEVKVDLAGASAVVTTSAAPEILGQALTKAGYEASLNGLA